ncbi:MAG: hypothetical protein ACE5JE_06205 [Thermoplasmata archaeon]
MPSGPRVLLVLFLGIVVTAAGVPSASGQGYPAFSLGDFWEYAVEFRLDSLPGFENVSGSLVATGDARVQVTEAAPDDARLSWAGNLSLQGRFTLPGETADATISGTIAMAYEEQRRAPYFLPIAFDAQAVLDGAITFIVTVPYSATLQLNATAPPDPTSPTYPLAEGNRTFMTTTTLATNLSVDFIGMTIQNSTVEEATSEVRWIVTPSASVEVPAGTFSGSQVWMEALSGFVPSPFQVLLPGAVQVTHHSDLVGSPVLYQFLANGTEVGSASLQTYSYASNESPPFWQNPFFLGGILAIPIALLLYRYWRERRRGL